jgi:hypothetical protein
VAELGDDLQKAEDSKDLQAILAVERVWGVVQCNNCRYWDKMDGYIQPDNPKIIQFICPECGCVENVKNPEAL